MSTSRPGYDTMASQSSVAPSGWGMRPPSPTFSSTTIGSKIHLPSAHSLITRNDLRHSIACFEQLMAGAKAYRNALLAMSETTAAFATAMEACSRLVRLSLRLSPAKTTSVKGCRAANSALAGASGLQFLMSNHEQILADTIYRQFEIPLLEALDHYKLITADRLAMYETSLHEQSARIRKTEAENHKVGRRKKRDLQYFRQALAELQRQVDELDGLKAGYHEEVLDGEDEVWETVHGKVAFVVHNQLDFYEKIAAKASDPILEPLVMSIPDPFDTYGPPKEDGQIFSVLAPLGMLDSGSPQSPNPGLSRSESLPTTSSPDASLPSKPVPFLASDPVPSAPATVVVQAIGQNGWDGQGEEVSRPRRELSVIEEKDPGLAHSRRSGENDDVGERSISGSVREDNEDISIAGSHEAV